MPLELNISILHANCKCRILGSTFLHDLCKVAYHTGIHSAGNSIMKQINIVSYFSVFSFYTYFHIRLL